MRLGITPYSVDESKQMLVKVEVVPKMVEGWSGMDNAMKIRSGHKWNLNNPLESFPNWPRNLGSAYVWTLR